MPSSTVAGYDLWSPDYDAHENPLIALSDAALRGLLPEIAGKRVLDLGCGTGRMARPLLAAGVRAYVGVDGSAGMLARARAFVDPRVTWLESELEALPDAPTGFDVVLFGLVLEHFPDVTPLFRQAASRLRPGGLLVALELHPELHARGVGAHFEVGGETIRLASHRHDAAELREACARAGLTPLRLTEWFPDADAIARAPKLARYRGLPVLLELRAAREDSLR